MKENNDIKNNLTIISDGSLRLENTHLKLPNGESLGMVQGFNYSMQVGELAKCNIHTVLNPAELEVLQENTKIYFDLIPSESGDLLRECYTVIQKLNKEEEFTDLLLKLKKIGYDK